MDPKNDIVIESTTAGGESGIVGWHNIFSIPAEE